MNREKPMTIAEYRALLRQPGTPTPVQPVAPLLPDERPEAVLLAYIQGLAKQHGWLGQHTWEAHGPHSGLECLLVRDVLLYAHVTRAQTKLTMAQETWLDALRRAGAEVVIWRPQDRARIAERLSRKVNPCP